MASADEVQLTVEQTPLTVHPPKASGEEEAVETRKILYNELALNTGPILERLRKNGDEEEHPHKHYTGNKDGLRAAVMGANDGLVSVASLIFGVIGGSFEHREIILAAVAALIGGAISMAIGEWISVYSARDCQMADVKQEKKAHNSGKEAATFELAELAHIYEDKGLNPQLAMQVAVQLSAVDVIQAHLRDELGIDSEDLDNPWAAAFFSFFSFIAGAIIPVLVCVLIAEPFTLTIAMSIAAAICMVALGSISACVSGASIWKTCLRITCGGLAGMAITYAATYAVSTVA